MRQCCKEDMLIYNIGSPFLKGSWLGEAETEGIAIFAKICGNSEIKTGSASGAPTTNHTEHPVGAPLGAPVTIIAKICGKRRNKNGLSKRSPYGVIRQNMRKTAK